MVMGIAIVLAGAGTMAYFSDTETSSGNNFTAGQLDLMIDFDGYYNMYPLDGEPNAGSWMYKDLVEGDKFFDFDDIKPGDWGEGTISIHVYDNPALLWITADNIMDNENGMNEPENEVDDTPEEGELSQNILFTIWVDCDGSNTLDEGEVVLCEGEPLATAEVGPVYIENCTDYYLGVMWEVPWDTGNIIQSDSVTFDITFYAEQARHNPDMEIAENVPCNGEPVIDL